MNVWGFFWRLIKMFYKLICCSASLFSLVFNVFWFFCNLASAGIPWLTLIFIAVCIASKFIRIKSPKEKRIHSLLGNIAPENLTYWPIANHGAGYDAPDNSKAALQKCLARGYRNVLLDVGLTACGEVVIANRLTLERAGLTGGLNVHTLNELQKINICELHPMGSKFPAESILTLAELLHFLEDTNLTVFLYIADNSAGMLEKLKCILKNNAYFTSRAIIVSNSPYSIYQLRKLYPELICGLWTEKSFSLSILRASTLINSIYGAIFRNIIAPVIGISLVFLSKDEFNLHIADLWRNVGVRPIAYTINSPNEKRYFQKTMKTQYLTDSLRSEPHMLTKA